MLRDVETDDRAALREGQGVLSDRSHDADGAGPDDDQPSHAPHGVTLLGLAAGMSMSLVAGAPYAFGAYAVDLKHTLHLSQSRMALLGVAYDFGLYLAQPVTGTFFDTFGTLLTAVIATVCVGAGYGAAALALRHVEGRKAAPDGEGGGAMPWETIFAICFFVSGMGSSFINVAALGTNVKRSLLSHRARVVAAHSTCFGLSSLLVVSSYPGLSDDGRILSRFFGVWAIIGVVVVGSGGAVLLSRAGGNVHQPVHLIEDFHREHADDASSARASPPPSHVSSRGHSRNVSHANGSARAAPPATSGHEGADAPFVDASEQPPHHADDGDVPIGVAVRDELTSLAHLAGVCVQAEFWLLVLTLFVAFGSGLFVINTCSAFVASAGGTVRQASIATALFPIGNACGRLVFGLLSTSFPRLRRGHWLTYALLLFALTYACAAATYDTRVLWPVYVLVFVSAWAYGTTWVVSQSILAESYPLENFGTMFGLIALTAGAAGFAFNEIGASLYEAVEEAGSEDCLGPHCFRRIFAVISGCATIGIAASLLYAPYTRCTGELSGGAN